MPSVATTVIGRPGMRRLKIVCAAALMIRSRTRSPGRNRPVQFSPGAVAVDEVFVGGGGHVRDVGRVHPHPARTWRALPREAGWALQLVFERELLPVEDARLFLELREQPVRVHEGPVGQQDHMLAVVGDRVGPGGIDDDRAVMPDLLLQAGMAVVPVGARLPDRELVDEGRRRLDAGEADARHAVHLERHDAAVPVDRRILASWFSNGEPDILAFLETDERRRDGAVDRDGMADPAVDRERQWATVIGCLCRSACCCALAATPWLTLHGPGRLQPGGASGSRAAGEERPSTEVNSVSQSLLARRARRRPVAGIGGAARGAAPSDQWRGLRGPHGRPGRSGRLGLALLVHAFHLAVLALHLLAAFLAVMLALLMLAVIHALVLGMARVGSAAGAALRGHGGGDDERDRADERLHVKFSRMLFGLKDWSSLQYELWRGVAISGRVRQGVIDRDDDRRLRTEFRDLVGSTAGSAAQVAHCISILAGASAGF